MPRPVSTALFERRRPGAGPLGLAPTRGVRPAMARAALSLLLPRAAMAAVLALPGVAGAQALSCAVPAQIARPRPDLPTGTQPRRLLPIGGYTLALTWSPEYCHGAGGGRAGDLTCDGGNRFGFTLHGLWPDGVGRDWPQYCRATPLLAPATIRANLCSTPSPQLLQHEWAKHGTCMAGTGPDAYFRRSTGLYGRLRYPDMAALSREPGLTAGRLAAAMAAANPGLPASAVRVTANARGWLDELWLCLDRGFAYAPCRADSGGVPAASALKIWRGAGLSRGGSRSRGGAGRGGGG